MNLTTVVKGFFNNLTEFFESHMPYVVFEDRAPKKGWGLNEFKKPLFKKSVSCKARLKGL